MTGTARALRTSICGAVLAASLTLAGCAGGDGVELHGRLLDAAGISTAALSAKRGEPQMQPRAPLVMPPSSTRLPEPGTVPPPDVASADQNWPVDRDQQRVASAAELQRQHDEYCRNGNWRERAVDNNHGGQQGPLGACGSIFSWTQNLFGGGRTND